jgi:mannose-6-phosphate isomerase-like protein (cupin superfamily)
MLLDESNLGTDDVEVAEITFAVGPSPTTGHRHGATEIFYIIEGVLGHVVNGVEHRLEPGMAGVVKPEDEIMHRVLSDTPVKAVVLWVPGGEGNRIAPAERWTRLGATTSSASVTLASGAGDDAARSDEELAVIAAAQAVFDAMEALDAQAFRDALVPDGFFMAVGSGTAIRTARDDFAARIAERTRPMIERMWDPEVRIDGPVATLWAPYDFYSGLEFSHCGTDAFQFAKTAEGWKVISITYTALPPPTCSTHPEGPPSP